ncbi:hypothetical protein ACFLW4_03770 [Chloroflexota bacterium]
MTRSQKYWTLIIIFLIAIIAGGSLVTWSKYNRSQPIEIFYLPNRKYRAKSTSGAQSITLVTIHQKPVTP